jgi:hypothetical protein
MEIKNLKFETNIYTTNIKLNKKFLSLFEDMHLEEQGDNKNNYYKKQFSDKIKEQTIYSFLEKPIKNILNANFRLDSWWVQKYEKENFHKLHTHGASPNLKSFVLYLNCTEKSSEIVFYQPGHPLIEDCKPIHIKPIKGLLIVFPSYIPHEVLKNKDNERLILSGNVNHE